MYAKIVDLPEGYSAYVTDGADSSLISSSEGHIVDSGIQGIAFIDSKCEQTVFFAEVKIPHYDPTKKNVFADGSIIEESRNNSNIKRILLIIGLTLVIIGLGTIGYIMIKGRLKHDK